LEIGKAEAKTRKTRRGRPNPRAIQAMTARRELAADKQEEIFILNGEKSCSHCNTSKALSLFQQTKRKNGRTQYASWCKDCQIRQRWAQRQEKYFNISIDESNLIVDYQKRLCAICKSPMEMFKRALGTDHDHKTGLIRGKLCWFCNKLLGIAQDNPERLLAAALYLVCPPAVIALGTPRFGLPGRVGTKKQRKLSKKAERVPLPPQTFVSQNPSEWAKKTVDKLTQI